MRDKPTRPVFWVGDSKNRLLAFPREVRRAIGFALQRQQEGQNHHKIKPLRGFSGVYEIVSDYARDTYRSVYAVNLGESNTKGAEFMDKKDIITITISVIAIVVSVASIRIAQKAMSASVLPFISVSIGTGEKGMPIYIVENIGNGAAYEIIIVFKHIVDGKDDTVEHYIVYLPVGKRKRLPINFSHEIVGYLKYKITYNDILGDKHQRELKIDGSPAPIRDTP